MADKLCIHSARAVERGLEGKDHHHAVHIPPHQSQPPALPRPQLRADEPQHGNAQPPQPPGEAKVDLGKVDENRYAGPLAFNRRHQPAVLRIDVRRVAHHLGEAHVGHVLGAHDAFQASVGHRRSA